MGTVAGREKDEWVAGGRVVGLVGEEEGGGWVVGHHRRGRRLAATSAVVAGGGGGGRVAGGQWSGIEEVVGYGGRVGGALDFPFFFCFFNKSRR